MASGAARRYAAAVFSLAKDQGTIDVWSRDLQRLGALVQDPAAAIYLENPNVPKDEKLALIDRVLENAQPEARNLAHMIVERRRVDMVPDLVAAFEEAALSERGVAVADVTTAVPLSKQDEERVRSQLQAVIGKQIEMRSTVDPAIIGGLIAQVGDVLIDSSVSSQLRRLRERLAATA